MAKIQPALFASPEGRRQAIVTLYSALAEEIRRYRDYEWQVAAIFAAALAWFESKLDDSLAGIPKCLTLSALIAFLIVTLFALVHVHLRLNESRNLRILLNKIMGFYERTAFGDQPLLEAPRSEKVRFNEGWPGVAFIWTFISFVLLVSIFVAWPMLQTR